MPQVALQDFVTQVCSGMALASFPTDTVPALAARPEQSDRIYALKQRPPEKPLILMGATWMDLRPYVAGTDSDHAAWQQVAERYWPGAVTLVLPASDRVPPVMNPTQTQTLGIRVPDHPLARYLLAQTGPLATTSVNRSGQPALVNRDEIAAEFPELLLLSDSAIADIEAEIGPVSLDCSGVPSTVVQWGGNTWTVLRQGAVTLDL